MTRPDGGGAPPPVPSAPASSVGGGAPSEPGELPQTFFLGRYRVVDEIGIGGMASVHLARVDGPGGFQKWVAIKRIHPHLVEDDQFVDMFLDEARIAAGINHANVAQVFDLGKDDNTYWIAMEYLHGEPLREVMRRIEELNGQIPFHVAAKICADAAEGLHGAHELRGRNGQLLNLVHRDVTPHNLFVTYEGYCKVVDFGIAKVVDRLASTRAGTLKGKLAYMSPEQVRGQDVDRRTDIFALGVVLWELTTNRRLFRRETDLDTLEQVQACVVPLPSTIIADYPPELEQVVMRALAQRREDRFQTAREFSRALQRFLMKQGTFVGPEDVGDYVKGLFDDRVQKRERYLEWAAEVTSAVDMDSLQVQQSQAEAASPSLLHDSAGGTGVSKAGPAPNAGPASGSNGSAPSNSRVQERDASRPHRSYGQDSASAAVVTSAPAHNELASTSLMDEDEDIPTIVAQPRYERDPEPQRAGPRPAAGMPAAGAPAQPRWDGASTQMMPDEGGLDATIALPDERAAADIRARLDQMDAQGQMGAQGQVGVQGQGQFGQAGQAQAAQGQQVPAAQAAPAQGHWGPPGAQPAAGPYGAPQPGYGAVPAAQANVETKMSLPRPAAVAQWLMEQGDIEIQGPRSTGVIIAIAALATLCVMGVASLIVYKLRLPPQPDPRITEIPAVISPAPYDDAPGSAIERDADDEGEARETSGTKRAKDGAKEKGATDPRGDGAKSQAKEPTESPGKLTINCKPACDAIVADGQALGPSPVFSHPLPPGTRRVTLVRGDVKKTIVVSIQPGRLTTQTVTM